MLSAIKRVIFRYRLGDFKTQFERRVHTKCQFKVKVATTRLLPVTGTIEAEDQSREGGFHSRLWDYRGGGSEPGRRFSFAVFQWKLSEGGQRLIPGNEYRRFSYS